MHPLIPVPGDVEDLFGEVYSIVEDAQNSTKTCLVWSPLLWCTFVHPDQEEASLNSKPIFFIKVIIFA